MSTSYYNIEGRLFVSETIIPLFFSLGYIFFGFSCIHYIMCFLKSNLHHITAVKAGKMDMIPQLVVAMEKIPQQVVNIRKMKKYKNNA